MTLAALGFYLGGLVLWQNNLTFDLCHDLRARELRSALAHGASYPNAARASPDTPPDFACNGRRGSHTFIFVYSRPILGIAAL